MIKKILTVVFALTIGIGFFVLLGTAGSSDLGRISDADFLVQNAIGLVLVGAGFMGLKTTNPRIFE